MLDLLPEITVVGAASDGAEALELADQLRPDAMLVDLHMPVLDGIQTTRQLSVEHPNIAVVMLTTYADDASILDALRAGARGTSPKTPVAPISRELCLERSTANLFWTGTSRQLCSEPPLGPRRALRVGYPRCYRTA
jgi:DNA-binding NarL/FixJ family response regulator